MKAVIYARYSSDNQREESIDGQLRECQAFAEKNDITVLGSYIDRALSAKTDDRPDFQRMIKDSEKGLFDVIIVWKLDRFARNRYDSAHYKHSLAKSGVKVVSATEPIANDATGILLESLLEGMAEYYSVELAEKIGRGMTENVLKGKSNGGIVTFGYQLDDERYFQVNPLTAPIVLEIYQMYADGKTMKEIRESLNARGICNGRGKPFTTQGIEKILGNRRYIGEYNLRDIVNPDAIPPIVPRALFDDVQAKRAKNVKASARYTAVDDRYLLTTKLYCGTCAVFMAGERGTGKSGKVFRYYKCANAKRGRGCKRKPIKKEVIEDFVIDEIKRFLDDDTIIDALANALMAVQDAGNTTLPVLNKELAGVKKGIEKMLDAIQQGILTPSTKKRLEELEARKEKIEIHIAQDEIRNTPLAKEQIVFWLLRFRKYDILEYEQRQRLVDTFVNAIYVFDNRLVLTFNYKENAKTVRLKDLEAFERSGGEVFEHGLLHSTKL